MPGGQLMNTTDVENYPGFDEGIMGPDLMLTMRKQAERMNTTIIDDVVVNVDFRAKPFKVLTGSEEYEAKAVIVCTGATPRKIGIEGEQTFSGKGVSYCATCDGAFFRNQDIAVVGGGDTADALELFGLNTAMTHVSTGGGASLELLSGNSLPAIQSLEI